MGDMDGKNLFTLSHRRCPSAASEGLNAEDGRSNQPSEPQGRRKQDGME